jgi:hypothetical protein
MKSRNLEVVNDRPYSTGTTFVKKLRLKKNLTLVIIMFSTQLFGQTKDESQVLKVSADMFRWEIQQKFDSLATLFDDQLIVVGSNGLKRSKSVYTDDLKNGKPVHNKIDVQEVSATIHGTTAIVVGKGVFNLTSNGSQNNLHLSYMEVFVNKKKKWKLVALYATRLPD